MAATKTASSATKKLPLYLVCIALVVAVIVALVGYNGKNAALSQNAELTAAIEEITTAAMEMSAELESANANLTAAAEKSAEDEAFGKNLNMFILNTFYLAPYDDSRDFYEQFEERCSRYREIVPE